VISDRRLEFNHDFDGDEIRILDKEPSWKKRIVLEMIHIKNKNVVLINIVIQTFYQKIISLS